MKIIFHENFYDSSYAHNPAADPGRMEEIIKSLKTDPSFEYIIPDPAGIIDLERAHSGDRINTVRNNPPLFNMASLAAGGAILAAEVAFHGEPAFACIRPPGHHASRDSSWDYCEFCNIGIALLYLKERYQIKSGFILDFDAHKGDGTIDVLKEWKDMHILNPYADTNTQYISLIEQYINTIPPVDIVAVSAGFDIFEKDVGKKLNRFDFYQIGKLMKYLCRRIGHNRRFAVLEGGYYIPELGKNVLAFCQGFQ